MRQYTVRMPSNQRGILLIPETIADLGYEPPVVGWQWDGVAPMGGTTYDGVTWVTLATFPMPEERGAVLLATGIGLQPRPWPVFPGSGGVRGFTDFAVVQRTKGGAAAVAYSNPRSGGTAGNTQFTVDALGESILFQAQGAAGIEMSWRGMLAYISS